MLSRGNPVNVEFWKGKSAQYIGWSSGERDICVWDRSPEKPWLQPRMSAPTLPTENKVTKMNLPTLG